jgi:hypothetical protein
MAGMVEGSKEVLIPEVFLTDVLYGKKIMLISDVRVSQISRQKK